MRSVGDGTTTRGLTSRWAPTGTSQATRTLLLCGVAAGPIYVVVGGLQVLLRDGYDLTRHSLSLMSNGDLGWIQITNFLLTGLLVLACATGIRRVLPPGRGSTWGPRLLSVHAIGLLAAGVFVADPYDGFPPGTPPGIPTSVSWHGALHMVAALVTFLSLSAACLVFARLFASLGRRGYAAYAAGTAVCYVAAFVAFFSSSTGQGWPVVTLSAAVILGWTWISITAGWLRSGPPAEPVRR